MFNCITIVASAQKCHRQCITSDWCTFSQIKNISWTFGAMTENLAIRSSSIRCCLTNEISGTFKRVHQSFAKHCQLYLDDVDATWVLTVFVLSIKHLFSFPSYVLFSHFFSFLTLHCYIKIALYVYFMFP